MSNYAGGGPAPVAAAASAPAAAAAPASAPLTVSQALAPRPVNAADRPIPSQGVIDADAPAEPVPGAFDNPHKVAATMESSLVSLGIDPTIAKFGGQRIINGLSQPAPTAEQIQSSAQESHAALQAEFGEDTDAILHLARQEVQEISKIYPEFLPLLVRAGLSSDLQTIKLLAGRGHDKFIASKRVEFGLPAR